ncbi:helix-turn-helix domain-containing protein [Yoonia sp. F2084L]|uniref:helix-turn-helix domain-containing protein n=1 Tax=Yoonia sp. F2084L TaxID=2926419 RepID=UPI001FF4651C|nr:helix-turn-helix domain-containing protein [Yoonia sp. F2084L]MCK0097339.1 helix-turn-helix domain-containing protein [Yoonia sp. F2084L]
MKNRTVGKLECAATAGRGIPNRTNHTAIMMWGFNAENSITNAMLSSGFNTKSNFNREFLRISGKSPSDWLTDHRATCPESGQS